jgi:hypothetical protein
MIRTKDLEKKCTHFWPMHSPKASKINFKRTVTLCVHFLLCILNIQEWSSKNMRRLKSLVFDNTYNWMRRLSEFICLRAYKYPRGLRHELSSLARKLGSWVRIPLKAWMSVCPFILFVLFCVQVEALWWADHSSKDSYRLCKKDYETEEGARAQ